MRKQAGKRRSRHDTHLPDPPDPPDLPDVSDPSDLPDPPDPAGVPDVPDLPDPPDLPEIMRILLLNQAFYPDVAATAQQTSDLAAELVAHGHDVTVVCGRKPYDGGEAYPKREVWRGVHIRRISALNLGKQARWRRGVSFGSYILNCVWHLAWLPRFDLVLACTSPPLISTIGAAFAQVKGGRFAFWVMDLNPDEAIAAGWLQPESRVTKLLSGLLNYSLRRSASVLVLDRFMARRIEEKGVPSERIATLPPWSRDDVVRYDAEGRDTFRKSHGLAGKFVIMYSGNHSPCHPLTTLLEAARDLRHRADVAFCFVGGGSQFAAVKQFATEHGLANITTLPYQPLDGLGASLSAADLHVVVMGEPYVGIVHPCKVYNIRSLGIPYLYIGPSESHVVDLQPSYSAAHGDVATVVRHVEFAAGLGPFHIELANEPSLTRQALLERTIHVLEAAAFDVVQSGLRPAGRQPASRAISETTV